MAMKKGISLVETLVALVILLVGIMGFVSAFSQNIYQSNAARNNSQAMFIATSFVEELRARPYDEWSGDDIQSLAAGFNTDVLGGQDSDIFFEVSASSITVGDALEGYTQLTVTVSWLDGEGADELREAGFGRDLVNAFVLEATIGSLTSDTPYGAAGDASGGNS